MGVRNSALGLADRGGGSHFQKGGQTIVVSHYSAFRVKFMPGCWKGGSDRRSNLRFKTSSADSVPVVFTLARILKGSWEFSQPVYMCFVDLEKAFDPVPRGVLREYGIPDSLLRAIRSLYACSKICVRILGINSDTFPVGFGLR